MDRMSPEERFSHLVAAFAARPGVTPPDGGRRFGSSALKVDGSIFAMLVGGRLVVKLPRERVGTLIAERVGGPFSAGKGRPMREWLTVTSDDDEVWTTLAGEAYDFVRTSTGRR
jgi:hypothetical protein